ncbi:MAG: DUF1015 family protein [Acidobacteriota bacterium]
MVQVRPFRAVRPPAAEAARVASVPYDVVSAAEARSLAAGDAASFLNVIRPEVQFEAGREPAPEALHDAARRAFDHLLTEGLLAESPHPALYLYRLTWQDHRQTGVVACCSVDEYDAGVIKKHEKTRPDKQEDRTRHGLAVGAHVGPVFLTYRSKPMIDELVAASTEVAPWVDFTAPDGVRHELWEVRESAALEAAFAAVPALYIADGHHRSASASGIRAALRRGNSGHRGDEPYNRFLSVLFPADQLRILSYNRFVKDRLGASPEAFLAKLRQDFEITFIDDPSSCAVGRVAMHLDGRWFGIDLGEPPEDLVAALDAAMLQDRILGPHLGIDDPRTSQRIDFVGGIRGVGELERRVAARPEGVAFALAPLPMDDLLAVADAGRVLPPKSTWFEPKLRSGLLIHRFEAATGSTEASR